MLTSSMFIVLDKAPFKQISLSKKLEEELLSMELDKDENSEILEKLESEDFTDSELEESKELEELLLGKLKELNELLDEELESIELLLEELISSQDNFTIVVESELGKLKKDISPKIGRAHV